MAPAGESDESGEDEAGGALSAAYVALWRFGGGGWGRGLRRRRRRVQLCRSPWVSQSWTSSCSPWSSTWWCLRFSSPPECGAFLLCCRDSATCVEDCRFHGTGAAMGSCRHARRCAATGAGVKSVQALPEYHRCSALAVGTAAVGWTVCSCFQAGGRSSSHR